MVRHPQRRYAGAAPGKTEALYLEAVSADTQGDHQHAAALLRRAIRQQPLMAILHGQMGNVLHNQGKYQESLASFQRALALAPEDPDHHNNLGNVLRTLGKLEDAIQSYRHGLSCNTHYPPLLINLAIVLNESGDVEEAITAYRQALDIQPDSVDALRNLAGLLKQRGEVSEALELYERLLVLRPELAPAHLNLGIELQDKDMLAEAVRCYEKVIALQPGLAAGYNNLGSALRLQEKIPEAIAVLEKAIALDPNLGTVYNNLGSALQADKKWEEALAAFERARTLQPDNPDAYNNIGNALSSQEKFDEALDWYAKALAIRPEFAEVENNLGNLLRDLGRLDEAVARYHRSLQLKPEFADAHNNLGNALKDQGRHAEALAAYSRAIELKPENPGFRWNKSLAELSSGELSRGWEEYEWGFACKQRQPLRKFPQPRWEGESLTGKTVLAWGEQGVGDEIMFANCIPDLAAAADRCIIECDPRLLPLFARSFPECEAVARTEPAQPRTGWPDIDLQVPMGNLPRWFRPSLESFPRGGGYLQAAPERVESWTARLAQLGQEIKVGISWRSRIMTANRRRYYPPLDQWSPLLTTPGVRFINLQYCEYEDDIAAAEQRCGVRVHHFEHLNLRDALDEVAALIAALDLVITVGNINMDLGGALNTKTWLFTVRHAPTWATLGAGYTPWFPSVRLFYRENEGWEPAVEAAAGELKKLTIARVPS